MALPSREILLHARTRLGEVDASSNDAARMRALDTLLLEMFLRDLGESPDLPYTVLAEDALGPVHRRALPLLHAPTCPQRSIGEFARTVPLTSFLAQGMEYAFAGCVDVRIPRLQERVAGSFLGETSLLGSLHRVYHHGTVGLEEGRIGLLLHAVEAAFALHQDVLVHRGSSWLGGLIQVLAERLEARAQAGLDGLLPHTPACNPQALNAPWEFLVEIRASEAVYPGRGAPPHARLALAFFALAAYRGEHPVWNTGRGSVLLPVPRVARLALTPELRSSVRGLSLAEIAAAVEVMGALGPRGRFVHFPHLSEVFPTARDCVSI